MCDGFCICCELVENGVVCLILFDIIRVILWVLEFMIFLVYLMKEIM